MEIAQYQDASDPERLEKLLARFEGYPRLIDQQIERLREGIADGRTSAAVPVRKAIEQMERHAGDAGRGGAGGGHRAVADDAARERVRQATEEMSTRQFRPLPRLPRRRVRGARQARCRASRRPPDGEAAYALDIRSQTSVPATAEEVHEFGLPIWSGSRRRRTP